MIAQQQLSAPSRAGNDGQTVRRTGTLPVTGTPFRSNGVAALEYPIVDSLKNSFSFYSYGAHPFWYEPMTNTLLMIKRGSIDVQSEDDIYLRISSDLGATWGEPIGPLHDPVAQGKGRYPNIYPVNPTNSTDRANLLYYYTAPTLTGSAGDEFGTFVSGLIDASGTGIVPPLLSGALSSGQKWSTDAHSVLSADKSAMITVGAVSDNNLAVRRLDVVDGNLNSFIPQGWTSDVFVTPDQADTRTSTFAGLDIDASGTMYAGIFARYNDLEVGNPFPAPGVSSSTDNGATWSEIDYMPRAVLNDYVTALGANPDSARFGFSTNDFIVTGPNSVSFLLNLAESDDTRDPSSLIREVVEVSRNNGTWNIRPVGTQNGWFLLINGSEEGDTASQVDNEIQVARTADGTRLLAKWTALLSYISQNDLNDDGMAPDTFTTSDVFVSSRLVSENTWAPPINVTGTALLDRQVWIPEIIPNDLSNVPAISVQSGIDHSTDITVLDSLVMAQRVLVDRRQYIVTANFDATGAISGVRGTAATAFSRLNAPLPNPSRDRSMVTFILQKGGHVTIDVYAATGQKVETLLDESREAGNHVVAMSTANLPAGTYYYTMRVNGEALTQSFTVVR